MAPPALEPANIPLKIGVTMGDPAGVGPEVIVKALAALTDRDWTPVVIGAPDIFEFVRGGIDGAPSFTELTSPEELADLPALEAALLPSDCPVSVGDLRMGEISPAGGEAAFRAVEVGIRLCRRGLLDGLCTAPLHKAALQRAGHLFPGHTEMLKAFTQAKRVAMCMVGGGLRTVPLTGHIPLRQVPARITADSLLSMLQLLNVELNIFDVAEPRIGVAGLNPHAGDAGALGALDEKVIRPAIERAQAKKIAAEGPIPGDVVFHQMLEGRFDVVLAMYHDQALIPIKTLAFDSGVNVTLGLPFVRTSPDHGTAYDIAGKGQAKPDSMIAALTLARTLIANKRALDSENAN